VVELNAMVEAYVRDEILFRGGRAPSGSTAMTSLVNNARRESGSRSSK
jgi:hypothetical protein